MIEEHLADQIIAETSLALQGARRSPPWVKTNEFGAVEIEGRMTDMVCACGGKLQTVRYVITDMLPPFPTHRKKRIRKKLAKRWLRETHHLRMLGMMVGAMQPPKFKCVECDKINSFYGAIGRNLITVEPLPEGDPLPGIKLDLDDGQPE